VILIARNRDADDAVSAERMSIMSLDDLGGATPDISACLARVAGHYATPGKIMSCVIFAARPVPSDLLNFVDVDVISVVAAAVLRTIMSLAHRTLRLAPAAHRAGTPG
jgi:hypothetical protein